MERAVIVQHHMMWALCIAMWAAPLIVTGMVGEKVYHHLRAARRQGE